MSNFNFLLFIAETLVTRCEWDVTDWDTHAARNTIRRRRLRDSGETYNRMHARRDQRNKLDESTTPLWFRCFHRRSARVFMFSIFFLYLLSNRRVLRDKNQPIIARQSSLPPLPNPHHGRLPKITIL